MQKVCETIRLLLCAVMTITACLGCGGGTGNEELAAQLASEIVSKGVTNIEYALERVDSAEQAGLFSTQRANTVKAILYKNADQRRMAAYYAEKAIAAEAGHVFTTSADSSLYCVARWILGDGLYADGEYGKSLTLTKKILAFVGDGTTPKDIEMKCRALTQMADCENELGHIAESERLFLQCIDILMESTQHATGFSEIDPLIYTLLSLNDLYIDNKMPEKALPLMAKMDTALNRLIRCSDKANWVMQMRKNNVTISKAMVYAANGQHEQAEALFREHQQSQELNEADKTAEGVYLTMMGRYDEAIRMFDEADSIKRTSGAPITNLYVNTLLNYKYDALQKAGRTAAALAMGDRIRQLTDSIRQQERQADVEQLREIKQQEEEIIRKHQSLTIHRIVLVAIALLLLMAIYIIWRVRQYNKVLFEKNHRLLAQIRQREREEQQTFEQLEATPEECLTANQQLYRRLCELMKDPDIFTNPDTNQDTLASLIGTNRTYIYNAIRECADQTPSEFINGYRLRHATNLLATTTDPISLIAELCGLTRVTFYRLFGEAYSMSPSDYRKVARKQFQMGDKLSPR